MKCYFRYRSDLGEEWVVFRDDSEPEAPSDSLSPSGAPAVTRKAEPPTGEGIISLRPAARFVDQVKNQVALEGRYYLLLSDISGEQQLASRESYPLEVALKLIRKLTGKKFQAAAALWAEVTTS
jgi:hypothetical protein